MAEDDFDKAFEGHDDEDEEDTEEAAEDAEFESEDEDEEGGGRDPNDEDFSEEWSEVPLPKKEEPGEGTRKVMRFVGPVLVVVAILGAAAGIYFSGVIGMVTEMLNSEDTEEVAEGENAEETEEEKNPFADKEAEEEEEDVPAEPEEVEAYEETVKVMVKIRKPAELWVNGVKQGRKKTKKAQLVVTPGEHTFRAVAKRGGLEMVLDIPPGPTVQVEIDVAKGILGIKETKAKKGKKGKKGKRRNR
jgi:hypothetical protein